MNYLTKDDFKTLSKYEKQLISAQKYNYVIGITSNEISAMIDIYERTTGKTLLKRLSCNACRLNALKSIAMLYDMTKAYYEQYTEYEIPTELPNEVIEEPNIIETKRRGRPKKK